MVGRRALAAILVVITCAWPHASLVAEKPASFDEYPVHEGCSNRLYVRAGAPVGGDGLSWATAMNSLSTALASTSPCLEIWVSTGTYIPASPGNRAGTFRLKSDVAIYGGFQGNEDSLDHRDWQAHPTVLSGDLNGDDLPGFLNRGDNSYHVLLVPFTTTSVVLDGLTIRGGHSTGTEPVDLRGGGLIIQNGSSLLLRNCRIEDNYATDTGGGFYASASTFDLENTTLRGNKSGDAGGAFSSEFPSATMRVTGSSFEENVARTGGAIYGIRGSLVLDRCQFVRNTADINSGGGGAVCSSAQQVQVSRCTFHGNRSRNGGATYFVYNTAYGQGQAQFDNCSFVGNYANLYGGAIYNWNCFVDVTNCTFTANRTDLGGAYVLHNQSTATSTITNSVLWANGQWLINNGSVPTVVSYSDLEVSCSGIKIIKQDPQFVRAANSGLDNLWGTMDDDYGDLRLQPTSPCIDIGNNEAVSTGTSCDLAPAVRILDHPDKPNNGNPAAAPRVVDLGAYEFVPLFRGDFDRDGDVDTADLLAFDVCAMGPAVPYPAGCENRDSDLDGDADVVDFAAVQRCKTGEWIAADTACR